MTAADAASHYRDGRARLVALASTLDADALATPLRTCPGWTVRDVYGHVVGVSADVVAGNLDGAPGDAWTAAQITGRRDRELDAVLAEWDDVGPRLEDLLRSLGDRADRRPPIDLWTHEQDIRGALGRPGGRDEPVVAWAVDGLLRMFARRWPDLGHPTARVEATSGTWSLGEGEPTATLRTDDFELLRMLIGRRSRAQVLAAWDGDAEPFVDDLVVFGHADTDVVE